MFDWPLCCCLKFGSHDDWRHTVQQSTERRSHETTSESLTRHWRSEARNRNTRQENSSIWRAGRSGSHHQPSGQWNVCDFVQVYVTILLESSHPVSHDRRLLHCIKTNTCWRQSEKHYNNLRRTQGFCQLIWKITDFREKVADAKAGKKRILYSSAFETHPYGYKMAVSLVPNGDGQGQWSATIPLKTMFTTCWYTIMYERISDTPLSHILLQERANTCPYSLPWWKANGMASCHGRLSTLSHSPFWINQRRTWFMTSQRRSLPVLMRTLRHF